MRFSSEPCVISASFLFCLLVVVFLLHTAASKGDVLGHVTVESVEQHLQVQQDGKINGEWPHLVFKSSQLRPPALRTTGKPSDQAGQYLFMTPKGPHRESSKPVVYTLDGDLVFVDERHDHVSDLKPQTYRNDACLTFSHGYSTGAPNPGHGYGKMVFLDNEYQEFEFDLNATITSLVDNVPGNLDFHEHIMTSSDTMYVTAYNNTPYDLSPLGGPKHGWLANSLFFEIDPLTGHVISSWSAINHIPLVHSRLPLPSYMGDGTKTAPFDHFHINSIQPLGADRLLINSRHTWCSYVLDRVSGRVLQTIDGHEHGFSWAHHARAHNLTEDGTFKMTLFDNHNMKDDKGRNYTQGLLLEVDQKEGSSRVIQPFNTSFYADSQGSLQALLNGNFLLGGGRVPLIIEYDAAGGVVWKARFEEKERGYSYRTFRGAWSGTPRDWHPVVAVENGTVYVSWNGATDVKSWNLYVNGKFCGVASKMGFETKIQLSGMKEEDCVSVGAVQDGKEVRRSNTAC